MQRMNKMTEVLNLTTKPKNHPANKKIDYSLLNKAALILNTAYD
jgi:hypothetical protein